ncbi:MAG: tyrosine-type recombinase/integrase [Gaiellaceae bacterium]
MTLYRQQFVDALSRCVTAEDDLAKAVRQSVVPFLRGNDMDEYGTVEQDLVWLVSSFEQLLGVSRGGSAGRRGSELHMGVVSLFSEHWSHEEQRLCRRWLEHLRNKRNELHGRPATTSGWLAWAHAVLVTLARLLTEHRLQAFAQGHAKPTDFVFCSQTGGHLDHRNISRRGLEHSLAKAGLPKLRWHDLRHLAASALISQGASIAYLSRILGHANPAITLTTYAHQYAQAEHAEHTRQQMEQAFGALLT